MHTHGTNLPALAVDQEVAIRTAYGHGDFAFGYKVKRVTATGQIVVESTARREDGTAIEHRFDRQGREMNRGSSQYYMTLEPDVVGARAYMGRKERSIVAARAINEAADGSRARWDWGRDALLEEVARLEALVAKARAAAEAI